MSAILQGADKAYLREYQESEDERRLDALENAMGSVRKATKGGKYLGSDVIDIMVQVQGFAEKLGIDPDELEYAENQVREAMNNLESAIYGLEEPFEDAIRALQNKIDDSEELDEVKYVDGFMGADGKPTSTPTAKDYASNKEFQHMKKKLGDKIPQPTKRNADGKLSPFKKDEQVEDMTEEEDWIDDATRRYFDQAFDKKRNLFNRTGRGPMAPPKPKPLPKPEDYQSDKQRVKEEESEDRHPELVKYEELLKRHDWTYNYSDDHRAWKKGSVQANEIRQLRGILNDLGLGSIASEMYDKHSPFTKKDANVQEEKQRLDPKCWDGYKKQGTKMKGDTRVNNCVPVKETKSNILRGLNESELQEGWKEWTAGALMIASLWGINNRLAQDAYDNSHQLQQLTQLYQVAQERSDTEKMKEVKERIRNHKTRLDIGKGDVDFDGRPGNDDIKDLDYIDNNPQ